MASKWGDKLDETSTSGALTGIWTSNYWKVTAMTHGDYNGDGYDEFVLAYTSADNWQSKVSLYQTQHTPSEIVLYNESASNNGSYYFSSLSSGDTDGDGFDELQATKIKDASGDYYRYKMEDETPGGLLASKWGDKLDETSTSGALTGIWTSNYWKVTAMTHGDYNGDGYDEFVLAYTSADNWQSKVSLYQTQHTPSEIVLYNESASNNGSYYFSSLSSGDTDGNTSKINPGITETKEEKVYPFELAQNYPNPFNPTTNISFTLNEALDVKLEIFDMLGKRISVLTDERMSKGIHNVKFNASNLNSGIYIYRITTNSGTLTKRMVLIK